MDLTNAWAIKKKNNVTSRLAIAAERSDGIHDVYIMINTIMCILCHTVCEINLHDIAHFHSRKIYIINICELCTYIGD